MIPKELNIAPLVDLFSILAIGLLVILTVTAGTESPNRDGSTITVVKFWLNKPATYSETLRRAPSSSIVKLEPYFIEGNVELEVDEIEQDVRVTQNNDSLTVMILGDPNELKLGIRVSSVVQTEALWHNHDATYLITGSTYAKDEISGLKMGSWNDPVIDLSPGS